MSKEEMFNYNDLKPVIMLKYLNDSMLDKLSSITHIESHRSGENIFSEGEDAENLYAVIEGKVRLRIDKQYPAQISISDITRGMTFGFSAVVDHEKKTYMAYAEAITDVKLYKWGTADLEALFEQDFEMGFLFMKEIAKIIKDRLRTRNIQFLDLYK